MRIMLTITCADEGCELCIVIEDVELSPEDNYVCFKVRLSCSGDRFEAEEIQMLCPFVDIDEYPCENEGIQCDACVMSSANLYITNSVFL